MRGLEGATTETRLAQRTLRGRIKRSRWAIALLAASYGFASHAKAQTSTNDEAAAIIVTAQKRPETLQRTPLSVLAYSAADLERASIQDFEDLPQIAPSLTISKTTQPANNSINIRGIGTYAFSIAVEPSVAVVIDDVPQAFQPAAFTSLVDVRQVEVLRGPQNTLFGKSSSAGVIKITTEPVSANFSGRIQMMQTDDHEQRVQTSISGPISSTLGYRLTASYSDFRGTLHNLTTGRWLNGQTDWNLRGKVEWRPTSQLTFTLSPFWTKTSGTCCTAAETYMPSGATTGGAVTGPDRIPTTDFLQGVQPGPDNRNIRMDTDARGDTRHAGGAIRAEYRGDGLTFFVSLLL